MEVTTLESLTVSVYNHVNDTKGSSGGIDWTYTTLTVVMSSLSMFGGLGISLIYLCYKDLRTPGRRLLVYLSLMDALTAFGNILGVIWLIHRDSNVIHKSMAYCRIQSAMTIFSSISSFSWTVVMGVCLLFSIVKSSPSFASKYMKVFHLVSWILPALVTIVALSTNILGYDKTLDQPSWCWIDPQVPHSLFWQFFTGKFWEIGTYITTVVLYSIVKTFLWKRSRKTLTKVGRSRKAALQEANMKLTFVPLVFIVFRIWGTLRFLLGFFAHDYASSDDSRWIAILQGIGDSAQGFANFVLYICMTEKIRQRLLLSVRCKGYTREERYSDLTRSQIGTKINTISSETNVNQNKEEPSKGTKNNTISSETNVNQGKEEPSKGVKINTISSETNENQDKLQVSKDKINPVLSETNRNQDKQGPFNVGAMFINISPEIHANRGSSKVGNEVNNVSSKTCRNQDKQEPSKIWANVNTITYETKVNQDKQDEQGHCPDGTRKPTP